MINFREIKVKDKKWMEPLITSANMRGCHQNFTNLFAWYELFRYRAAQIDNYLVIKGKTGNEEFYFYPAGTSDIRPVIEAMYEDSLECGHEFKILGLSPENREELSGLYPDCFKYEYMRDSSDYIYYLDKLINLEGNRLRNKRNYINFFKRHNRDNWTFELITPDNLEECWKMNEIWSQKRDCSDDVYLYGEYCAVQRCFDNYFDLDLEGGLIRVGDKIVAFTIGEKLNSDTYVIHIEKAFNHIKGSYQMINREFAIYVREIYPELIYMNREDDMGHMSLRDAKLSYRPDKMENKYAAILMGELK